MTTDATILPLRTLDDEARRAIRYFYTPSSGVGLFLATYLPVTIGLSLGGAFFGVWPGLIAGITIAALWVLIRRLKIRRNISRAEFIYQYGAEEEITFNGISSNYGFKVNGAPQQVISIMHNGVPAEIKTFDPNVILVYSIPRQAAYTHPEYPGVLIPSGLFRLQPPVQVRSVGRMLRRALVYIVPFAFIFGLTFVIQSSMSSNSSTYAQPDARIYRQDGRLMLATVVTRFQAYEVSNKGVFGNDNCFAKGMDLETGKELWKIPFHAKNSRGNDAGGARLLGQSARYLFFLRNDLYVIDKATGRIAAQNKDFPALAGKMSREMVADYEDDAGFTYNDSLGAVVIKGTDGLFYTIDGTTLQTGTTDIPEPDDYFKNRYKYGNNYEDQISAVYDDGSRCLALLDAKDTTLLAHNPYGVQERPASESIRRTLYSCSSMELSDGWATLNRDVFLFGGFLMDASRQYQQPQDTVAKYASFQSLLMRYNHANSPVRTAEGGFVILHKTSIENTATLLLTGVSRNGVTRWQVSTGYASIPLMYDDAADDKLYISGSAKGDLSDRLTEVQCIDLKTGGVVKYGVK